MEKIIKKHIQQMECKRCGHRWTREIINVDIPKSTEIILHNYCGCGQYIQREINEPQM